MTSGQPDDGDGATVAADGVAAHRGADRDAARDAARDADLAVAAFEGLFAANHDDLLRYAARRVGPDAAPDVVADVMLVAWRRRGEYSTDEARLWLFGVAHNMVVNERRAAARRIHLAVRAEGEAAAARTAPPDPAEEVTDAVRVRAVLEMLPSAEQEALRLTEWERMSPAEAARVTGCSAATFRVRLHRARRHFARQLADSDDAGVGGPNYAGATETTRVEDVPGTGGASTRSLDVSADRKGTQP